MKKIIPISTALGAILLLKSRQDTTENQGGINLTALSNEYGAKLLRGQSPLRSFNLYLAGFHFFSDNLGHQIEAHHYCTVLNDDFMQCVVYDSNSPEAKLIGIEYIVSEKVFRDFPDEEKKLWHSHSYEVKSGHLIAPGMTEKKEHRIMEKLVKTYGKIWNTWDSEIHSLPVGIPSLLYNFTSEGQIREELLESRDIRLRISSTQKKHNREDIPSPEIIEGADAWGDGDSPQLTLTSKELKILETANI